MTYLEIRALRKRFGAVTALSGIDLDVPAASRTAIVGPSGSGKTTLLRLIAGFDVPDAGSITLGGQTIAGQTIAGNGVIMPPHRRGIGVIAQDGALFPHLSVGDNIGFGLDRNDPGRRKRIESLAQTVGLDVAMLARRPDQISGGQQQRVAIARALARKPRLMLLDEPFSALDTGLRGAMRKAVGNILDQAGVTSILVTHDQSEALSFADQLAIMNRGSLEQVGRPRDLYMTPASRMVAEFLGEAIILPARIEAGMAHCLLGALDVIDAAPEAASHVMIRPEQVALTRAPTQAAQCAALVTAAEFAGSRCSVSLRIDAPDQKPLDIALHASPYDLPEPGARVFLSVLGPVHPLTD